MKRAAPGPHEPLTREQERWVETGMVVVARCARRHARRWGSKVTYEELLSLGSIGLMQAVRSYRPDAGVAFDVYCYKRIDGAMRYGMRRESQFYALIWDSAYAHLETTRDEGPSLDEEEGGDEAALHVFSDRVVAAVARKLLGEKTWMDAATTEDAVAEREEWARRLRFFQEEMERTSEQGRALLRMIHDEGMDLKSAAEKLGLNYGQARRLYEATLDDLGARIRRRVTFKGSG